MTWGPKSRLPEDGGEFVNTWQQYNFELPETLIGAPQDKEIEAHAQRVEAVYQAELPQQKALLEQYATQQLPMTSDWAVQSISTWNTDESYSFLTQLAQNSNLSLAQVLFVDYQLLLHQRQKWLNDPIRTALLRRLFAAVQTHDDMWQLAYHLVGIFAGREQGIAQNLGQQLIINLLTSPLLTPSDRQQLISLPMDAARNRSISWDDASAIWLHLLLDPQYHAIAPDVAKQIVDYKPASLSPTTVELISATVQQFRAALLQATPADAAQLRQAIDLLEPSPHQSVPTLKP